MRVLVAVSALLAGCNTLLGLDETKFEQRDATVDAPSACDGAPRCTSTTGRSVCGQLYGGGSTAGQLVRATDPTGETCTASGSTTGPCAFTGYAQPLASYYSGSTTDQTPVEIDDCGRFVAPDLMTSITDVAVVFNGTDFVESVTLVLDREMMTGDDRGIDAPLIPATVLAEWPMQIDATTPPSLSGGYLVTYVNANGDPIPMQELRINGGAVSDPPTTPWGAYFGGTAPYGMIDNAATTTGDSGSALVVPGGASLMLGGFRTGRNCPAVMVQPHANAFIHIALSC